MSQKETINPGEQNMRMSKTSRRVIVIALVPLVSVLIYLALPLAQGGRKNPPAYASLHFVGFTNDPSSNLLAQFIYSNKSPHKVFSPNEFGYYRDTNEFWRTNAGVLISSSIPQQVLEPGGTMTINVPFATNEVPWRLTAGAVRVPSAAESFGLTLRRILPNKLQFIPDRILYTRDRYTGGTRAYSETVEPRENNRESSAPALPASAVMESLEPTDVETASRTPGDGGHP